MQVILSAITGAYGLLSATIMWAGRIPLSWMMTSEVYSSVFSICSFTSLFLLSVWWNACPSPWHPPSPKPKPSPSFPYQHLPSEEDPQIPFTQRCEYLIKLQMATYFQTFLNKSNKRRTLYFWRRYSLAAGEREEGRGRDSSEDSVDIIQAAPYSLTMRWLVHPRVSCKMCSVQTYAQLRIILTCSIAI